MPSIPMHVSELIMECFTVWLSGSGRWTPTLHRYPKPILYHQDGPTILLGGLLLAGMTKTTAFMDNQMYLVDTFVVRYVMARPIKLAVEGTQVEPVEIMRLDRHPEAPVHEFVLTCASTLMCVYFGLIAGDLAKYGKDERVPECPPPIVPIDPPPDSMVTCPNCRGMLFPSQIDHPWPVYRSEDMRIIHRV